jgi:hypothetical protein
VIPNITKGSDVRGLMGYLVGPGKRNEHTHPHLVAGSGPTMAWYDDAELNYDSASALATELDRARRVLDVAADDWNVWHCSLSFEAAEGIRTDQEWATISQEFMDDMGFTEASGKAPCSWLAVHHGQSINGNDHIHIVASRVREDGTKWFLRGDYAASQKAARAIEQRYGWRELSSTHTSVGYHPAEQISVARRRAAAKHSAAVAKGTEKVEWKALGAAERTRLAAAELTQDQPRFELARAVRACSVAAADEAEFVRLMRQNDLLVRPRFADGTTDVVTGFSVATKPLHGERPIWYGGGHLGKDLTLPVLRSAWADSIGAADAAAAEWTAASRGRRPVAPDKGREAQDSLALQRYSESLEKLASDMRAVTHSDTSAWAQVARDQAGVTAAWSRRLPQPLAADMAATSDALARTAQVRNNPVQARRSVGVSARGMATALLAASPNDATATVAVLRQLKNLGDAMRDMHSAAGDLRLATATRSAVSDRLVKVYRVYNEQAKKEVQQQRAASLPPEARAALEHVVKSAAPSGPLRPVLPAKIESPAHQPQHVKRSTEVERN